MTNIGKVLAIFTTLLSLAFLGMAFAARIAGPNWEGEALVLAKQAPYYIEKTDTGKETTYTVKDIFTGEAAKTVSGDSVKANTKLLPEAIEAAFKDEAAKLDEKITALNAPTPKPVQLEAQLKETDAHQKADRKAMETREVGLKAEHDRLAKQLADLTVESDKVSQEALGTWKEGELRREDVYRLRNHLEELEVDLFQGYEQKKRLQDELSQLRGIQARLQRRNERLNSSASYQKETQ